jgi:cytoskeletal protein CcmA (bactofilin family)
MAKAMPLTNQSIEEKTMTRIKYLQMLPVLLITLSAADFIGNEEIKIAKTDTLRNDLFTGSRYFDLDGQVDGDLFTTGQRVRINGSVTDNIMTWAETFRLNGSSGGEVISMGRKIEINGKINGDLMAFGAEVRILEGAEITADVYAYCGNFNLDGGIIRGSLKGGMKNATLNGLVEQNTHLNLGAISFGENFNGLGPVRITVGEDYDTSAIANPPADMEIDVYKEGHFFYVVFGFWSFVSKFIVGLLIIVFMAGFSNSFIGFARGKPADYLGYGLLLYVATPIAIVLLILLLFTIPVALMLGAVLLIASYIGQILAALVIGDFIGSKIRKKKQLHLIVRLLIGLVVVSLITAIPFLGWFVGILVAGFGLGSLFMYGKKHYNPAVA